MATMASTRDGVHAAFIALIMAGLSMIGTLWMEFGHNDREVAQRVSTLEAHRNDDEKKIDHIQEQVDKLVQWAMGGGQRMTGSDTGPVSSGR